MEPVRVKLYGMVPVTKRRYVRQLAATVVLLAVLLGFWWFVPEVPLAENPPPHLAAAAWLLKNLPWLVLGLAALVLLEAVVVFRRFAHAEATQENAPAGGPRSQAPPGNANPEAPPPECDQT